MTAAMDAALEPRERILRAASDLMSRRGIRDVSLEDVASAAAVTVPELQVEFVSKDRLAAAFLERRELDWTVGVVEAGARARATKPVDRLLAIFDVFHDWFNRDDYEACSFINVLLEMGTAHPLGIASREYLANIRHMVRAWAIEAELEQPDEFARSWHILMKGSIISAVEGDSDAARRAQRMARSLIERHTPPSVEDQLDWDLFFASRPSPGDSVSEQAFDPFDL